MAMNLGSGDGSREPEVMVDINTTPLIDVMLVLLIMLIITIPIQTHSVKLNMPVANQTPPPRLPEVIRIDVNPEGTILWNGDAIADRSMLEQRLRVVAAMPTQPEIHLRADKLALYKYVAEVLASAQRLGVTKIGIVGNEQFAK
jgi:biopolymer transport protein ExbD